MPRRFDAVVFDWYATLGAPDPADWWLEMWQRLEAVGATVPDAARAAWSAPPIDHRHVSVDEPTYREYEEGLLAELIASSGLRAPVADALLDELMALRDAESIGVYPDVDPLLAELRASGAVVALCSNWSWDLERHLEANRIREHFDAVVCSAIVGYRKPHPAIFEHLLSELGLPAERIAFVGDDWHADIEGAGALGIATFHLAREGCTVDDHGAIPCATGLEALRPLLL